jgi:hypothetical protein
MDEMGENVRQLLEWMLEVAEARNSDPKARTVNLKFSRATLTMWQQRAREALEQTDAALAFAADVTGSARARLAGED